MRLLSHTNWRAFILLYYYYYYWVGYARRGVVALICEFLLGTFPSRRLAATTAAALSHSHLPHFVARARALALLLFAQRRVAAAWTTFALIAYGAQTINHNGTNGTLAVAQCQLVAITKQNKSKANRN